MKSAHEREVEVELELERNETRHVVDALGQGVLASAPLWPVDALRSTSNDPNEMARRLGIEAAAAAIHHEVDGDLLRPSKVENRHALVADAMTHCGFIVPMSRHGMNRPGNESGALVQASFEETTDVLTDAATFGKTDPAEGVTFSVMSGEESGIIGTGSFDVLVPSDAVRGVSELPNAKNRLARSVVHYAETDGSNEPTVGYVDNTLWCFRPQNDTDGAMNHPFLEAPMADAVITNKDGRAEYGVSDAATAMLPKTYVPSSPVRAQHHNRTDRTDDNAK